MVSMRHHLRHREYYMIRYLVCGVVTALVVPLASAQSSAALSTEQKALMETYYRAFHPGADAASQIRQATSSDWKSCATNTDCLPREQLIGLLGGFRQAIPDLSWQVLEFLVAGERIVARGEGTGTPAGDFMGVPHAGKSFRITSIDIHTVRNNKIVHTYHLEDWASALRQLSGR